MMRRRLSNSQQSGIFFSACMLALFWRAYLVFVHGTPITTLPRWTYSATDTRFDSILMGCVLAVRFNPKFADSTPLLTRHKGLLAVGGLILLAFTLVMREPHWRETLRYTVQGVALFPVFFYCVSESSNPIIRLLEMAPIRWLGQVSYAMYLTHALIIRIVESSIVRPSSRFVIALLFTILAGWAVRNLVELPLRTVRDWLLIRVKGVTHGGHPIGFYGHSQGSLTPKVETR
jgi:peptidoglycan/LPS O-acetylase OafA/YrhL